MMQKYFGLGKEYLTKKIQQFNAVSSDADYLTQQIPSRLRQPLAVLQQEQIDIEDAHAYENYYKNYPNHHISHFLLDKYNMMVQAEAQPNKYVSPVGEDSQILHFDSKLENKALLLRQAIQQYDEGFCKTDDPIVCLTVINFHHKRGTQVEYRYPQNKEIESLEQSIIHHAMPDSSHNKPEDYNFFNFEAEYKGKKRMLFGVSYFKQIKLTEEMKKQNSQLTRSYLQKAVAIISVVPLFGYLKIKLSFTTKFFFVNFRSFGIIQEAYKEINSHLAQAWPNIPISDLNIGTDLRSILQIFDIVDFYEIWKAVLYQKRIVVYGHSSSSVSSFLLSLLSLFPGQNTFGIFSKPIAKYMQSLRQLALPLKLFNSDNFLMFSFHIQNYTLLNKFKKLEKGNYLIGTTNRLVKQSKDIGVQLLVNLENCTIEKKNSRRPWQPMNRKQKTFINQLAVIAGKQKGLTYQRSQDSIRDHFHNFLKGALVELITAIRSFQKFTKQCLLFSQQSQQQKPSNNNRQQSQAQFFPPLLPEQVKKMTFPELLLQKSFAYFRQFKNENFPEIIKGKQIPSLYINNYDYYLRLNSQDFIVYNWLDKKLSFGKGSNTKNFEGKQIRFKTTKDGEGRQETKSIYVGNIQNGKFQKNGFYVDAFQRYEGEYSNGAKEGYGKYITGNEKYIGDFVNNIYEGQGQLLIGTDVYVGSFKNGLKSGYGTMQGTMQFDGFWEDNKPKISMKQVKAKEEHERNYKNVEEGEQDSEVPVKKSDFSAKLEKKVEKIIKEIQGKGESEVKNMENVATNRTQKTKTKQNTKNEKQQQKHQEKQDRQKIEAKQEQQKKEKVENEQRTEEKVKQQAQEQRTSQKIEQKVEVEVKTETNEQMGQQNKEEKAENE